MGNTLYLECNAGISGDMFVASLLDLGASQDVLTRALASLPIDGFTTRVTRVKKAALDACSFDVILDEQHENHDHDMEYLYGHIHEHEDIHEHMEDIHDHDHTEDVHDHDHTEAHVHAHSHRSLQEILQILAQADLSDKARETAVKIFTILAQAEAKAHGTTMEEVHFHEVGAVDSIADIVAAAVCLDNLNITQAIIPSLSEGYGTVRSQHGILPVPVPAVSGIAMMYHLNLHIMEQQGEFVTPTGAAIAAAIMTSDHLPEQFQVCRMGLGAGKRNYQIPSLLRAFLITQSDKAEHSDTIWKLECNLDDCSGEILGYTMEQLFAGGARDVHYIPVYMKKNRPGIQLNVICDEARVTALEQIIFRETTTIGIRKMQMQRTILPREEKLQETPYGAVMTKVCTLPDGTKKIYPEYESVKDAAEKNHCSFQEVFQSISSDKRERQKR